MRLKSPLIVLVVGLVFSFFWYVLDNRGVDLGISPTPERVRSYWLGQMPLTGLVWLGFAFCFFQLSRQPSGGFRVTGWVGLLVALLMLVIMIGHIV